MKEFKREIRIGQKIPQVVKVAWFIAGFIGQSCEFLNGDFPEVVGLDDAPVRKISVTFIRSKDRDLRRREANFLLNRDVHLDVIGGW